MSDPRRIRYAILARFNRPHNPRTSRLLGPWLSRDKAEEARGKLERLVERSPTRGQWTFSIHAMARDGDWFDEFFLRNEQAPVRR